ncbi:hypothetical protein F5Y16DRAFT_25681 [Xylariaceae sp. FL0255]|nr:hypothetical protein F5Y16DRAFT_25681 [Xylariaceae sp. FL0255]
MPCKTPCHWATYFPSTLSLPTMASCLTSVHGCYTSEGLRQIPIGEDPVFEHYAPWCSNQITPLVFGHSTVGVASVGRDATRLSDGLTSHSFLPPRPQYFASSPAVLSI